MLLGLKKQGVLLISLGFFLVFHQPASAAPRGVKKRQDQSKSPAGSETRSRPQSGEQAAQGLAQSRHLQESSQRVAKPKTKTPEENPRAKFDDLPKGTPKAEAVTTLIELMKAEHPGRLAFVGVLSHPMPDNSVLKVYLTSEKHFFVERLESESPYISRNRRTLSLDEAHELVHATGERRFGNIINRGIVKAAARANTKDKRFVIHLN